MKHAMISIICLGDLLVFLHCTRPNSPVPDKKLSFSLSLRESSGQQLSLSWVDSMNLRIFHKNDSLHFKLPFEGASADTRLSIPSATPVRFLADAYKDSRVIMQGDTTITAGSGEKIDLNLSLEFVTPAVILTPSTQDVQAGDSVNFDVAVRAMQNKFYKAVTRIEYDPNILSFRSAEKDKEFLRQNAGDVTVQLTDTEGLLIHDVEITPRASAVSGQGNLTTIRMQALRSGRVSVTISNDPDVEEALGIYDRSDQLIPVVNLGCVVVVN